MSVKDSATFTLNEADLTGKKVGELIETPKRAVPCSDGLQWWIDYRPAGWNESYKGHVSVYLFVNKPVTAKCTFAVGSSSISKEFTYEFNEPPFGTGYCQYASHEELRPLFRDGKVTITGSVEFTSSVQSIPVAPAVYKALEYTPPDFDLVVGSNRIQVHKNFISLISTVYFAMFKTNCFRESESEETVITDFNFNIVKTAIDYSYGRELKLLSAETYVGVLRFADKMDMKKIIADWENLIPSNLSKATFCDFLQYAYDFEKHALMDECYKYFKTNQSELKLLKRFAKLPPILVVKVLKAAFELKSDDQVARHARIYGINFIRDYLETCFINAMSVENFHTTARYAWEFSQESLQKACAQFLNDNRDMVTTDDAFLNLPPETVCSVLQYSAKRKRDAEAEHSAGVTAKRTTLEVST
uniref:BTB domain-containing protein n=1 Tax=Panagrellus redivivus TaxID=6233 RepID=A0A7E4W3Y8_PANRE